MKESGERGEQRARSNTLDCIMKYPNMLLRWLLVACLAVASGARDSSSARRMSRTPLAVGALSGLRFIHEPYLLEFHGAKCDHCEVSRSFV